MGPSWPTEAEDTAPSGGGTTIDAQAGKTYVVKGKRLPAGDAAGFIAVKKPRAVKVVVWIEDAETGAGVVGETACQPVT